MPSVQREPGPTAKRVLAVRVDPGERQLFAEAAELRGQEVAEWVRNVLGRSARQQLAARPRASEPVAA